MVRVLCGSRGGLSGDSNAVCFVANPVVTSEGMQSLLEYAFVSFSLSVWPLEIRVLPTCTKLQCQGVRAPALLQIGSLEQ